MNGNIKSPKLNITLISILFAFIILASVFLKENTRNFHNYFYKTNINVLENIMDVYIGNYKKNLEYSFDEIYKSINYEELFIPKSQEKYLAKWSEIKKFNPSIKLIYASYSDNKVLVNNRESNLKDDYQYITWKSNGDRPFWSDPHLDNIYPKLILTLSRPIKDKNNKDAGVLAVDVDLTELSEGISSIKIPYKNELFLVNKKGKILVNNSAENIDAINFDNKKMELFFEKSSGSYKNEKGEEFVFYTSKELNWVIIMKISKNEMTEYIEIFTKNIAIVILILVVFLIVFYELQKNKVIRQNKIIVSYLKKIKNGEHTGELLQLFNEKSCYYEIYEELNNLQTKIESIEKELIRDDETGLYNQIYVTKYGGNSTENDYKILIIKYQNLFEINENYGKNVVDLVLKRGAMTINALKESDEYGVKIDENSIAIVLKNGNMEKRASYIIEEILNYKWKLHNIDLILLYDLINFDQYRLSLLKNKCENEI